MTFVVELAARKGSVRNLGFQRTNFGRSIPLFFGLIVVWVLAFFLTVLMIMGMKTALSPGSLFSMVFMASVFFHPGFVEILAFRGFLQTRLERLFSARKALVFQAVIFGLYHVPPAMFGFGLVVGGLFCPLFAAVFGAILGAIYAKTRNLFVTIGLHASILELFLVLSAFTAR
jgi:membrane protease YdiL (CAAX protease family)